MGKVFGVVLAGGVGLRMGEVEKPKQFLELKNKPILIHTLEKFVRHPGFAQVLVLSPKDWIDYTRDIIRRFIPDESQIAVLEGGATRNETVMNAVRYIESQGWLDDETIVVTHDAVRPFLTQRILSENIRYAGEYGACDTVIPATDTIVQSDDGLDITQIPERKAMYQGQTPQSFKAKKLKEVYDSLTEEEKNILTDSCKIMSIKGERVHLVKGEVTNIKITYADDIVVARALMEME